MTSPTPPPAGTSPGSLPDPAMARRHRLFLAETKLTELEFMSTCLDMRYMPLQVVRPSRPEHPQTVVRSPAGVESFMLTHPVYFIEPDLVGLIDTDGDVRERYVLRMHRLLDALGLLDERGAPSHHRVEQAAGGPLSEDELRAHRQGLPSRLDRVLFTEADLRIPYAQHLSQVWDELGQIDPEGNARLAPMRASQTQWLEELFAARAAQASAAGAQALFDKSLRAYEQRSGLSREQYAANEWGYPFVPAREPWEGETRDVLVQAPANVKVSFLGHPVFWCDPRVTAFRPLDGNGARYCVRMFRTLQALGAMGPNSEPRDVLKVLGDGASETHRRNHLLGRPTPMDRVYLTWDQATMSPRQVLQDTWEELGELDPEGNATLAQLWQEQLDEWAHEDYLAEKAAAAQVEADRLARKQRRQESVISTIDAAVRGLDRIAERSAAKAQAREDAEKRLARQLYIEQSRRRR